MKRSSITLLSGLAFVFLIALSLIVFFRFEAEKFIQFNEDDSTAIAASGVRETREFNLKDFDSLYFENMWDVQIEGSNEYSIEVEADKAILDNIEIEKNGSVLSLEYEGYIRGAADRDDVVKAIIKMPLLKELEFSGMGNIRLKELDLERLGIIISGASNIEAENTDIDYLYLNVNGASNADLDRINIQNCELDISGAANINLNMSGGELTGTVSGAASVTYGGTVKRQDVKVSGIGSLERQ